MDLVIPFSEVVRSPSGAPSGNEHRPPWKEVVVIVVTGSTGTIGRPLIQHLVETGEQVRAVVRRPVGGSLPSDVEVVECDLSCPEGLGAALRNVSAVFVHPRAVGMAAPDLLHLAAEQGVRRVVGLSAINVDDPLDHQPSRFQGDRNKEVEEAIASSGLPWVSVRAGAFAINISMVWAAQIRGGSNVVRGPYGSFAEAVIHEHDLGAVIAAALCDHTLAGPIPVTGQQALTYAQMVTTIGKVIGRPLRYEEISVTQSIEGMVAQGVPRPFVEALMARYARDIKRPVETSDNVAQILGRPAKTYSEWVADHAAAFVAD
jgi:uncharacterized protein YbjT (DUF2867 family)